LSLGQRLPVLFGGPARFFDLSFGHNAAQRIINAHQLTRPPKRPHRRRNNLRAVKAACVPFTRLQMDVKYLTDIPF